MLEFREVSRKADLKQSDRSRQELPNELLVAKFGFGKAVNAPSDIWNFGGRTNSIQVSAYNLSEI